MENKVVHCKNVLKKANEELVTTTEVVYSVFWRSFIPWNELRPHLLCKHCKLQLHHFWAYMHDGHDHWKRNEVNLKEVKSVTVGTPNTEECKEWYHDRKTCCSLNFAVSAYKQDSSLTERSLEKGKYNICVVYGPMFPFSCFLYCDARPGCLIRTVCKHSTGCSLSQISLHPAFLPRLPYM